MEIQELLQSLARYEKFPEAALREATARRAEVLPAFLRAIDAFIAAEKPSLEQEDQLFLIVHLFGTWQEKSAYRPVMRLLSDDPEKVGAAFGDALTDTIPQIVLNLFDGDPQPLRDLIENETAHGWARAAMFEILATLAERGDIAKDEVANYLRDAFSTLRPQDTSDVWIGWQAAVALLGLEDMSGSVEKAFEREFIDMTVMDFEDFQSDLRAAVNGTDSRQLDEIRVAPFGDTVETLSKWYGFSDEYLAKRAAGELDDEDIDWDTEAAEEFEALTPVVNPLRHVGRNDPCPCGSGKKFKRCCLGKTG